MAFVALLAEVPLVDIITLMAAAAFRRCVFGFSALFVARGTDQAFVLAR